MAKDILYDFKSLICTDPDCLQFAKKEMNIAGGIFR